MSEICCNGTSAERREPLRIFIALACCALIFSMPWMRHSACAMPGALRAFTAEIAAFLIFGLILWIKERPPVTAVVLMVAFLLWSGLSWFWSVDTLATGKYLRTAIPWTVLVIVFCLSATDRKIRKTYLIVIIAAGSLTGLVTLCAHQWLDITTGPIGRYQWPYDHTAALSGALVAPAVGLCIYLIAKLRERKWISVLISLILLIPVFITLFYSGTRSPLLGIAAGIYFGIVLALKDALRKIVLLLGITLISVSALLIQQHYATPDGVESMYTTSFGTRIIFGRVALAALGERPLTGLGAGAFPCGAAQHEEPDNFLQAQRGDLAFTTHSESLQIASETGLPGLMLWLAINLLPVIVLFRKKEQRLLDIIIVSALVAMFADSCGSMSMRYHELPWHYAIILGLGLSMTASEYTGRSSRYAYVIRFSLMLLIPLYILAFSIPGLRASLQRKRAWVIWGDKQQWNKQAAREEAGSCLSYAKSNSASLFEWYYAAQLEARLEEQKKESAKAINLRKEFLRHFPSDFVNRQKLIKLCWGAGEWESAFSLCVEGLQLNLHSRNLDFWLKRILHGTTIKQLSSWCRRSGLSSADTVFLHAQAAFLWGNLQPALHATTTVSLEEVAIGLPQLAVATWLVKSGDEIKARHILKPIATKQPVDPRILGMFVQLLSLSKDKSLREEAASYLIRLTQLGSGIPEAIGVAAPIYVFAGTSESRRMADDITLRAVAVNPDDAELYSIRIETLLRLGHREEALKYYRIAHKKFLSTEQSLVIEAIGKKYELSDNK